MVSDLWIYLWVAGHEVVVRSVGIAVGGHVVVLGSEAVSQLMSKHVHGGRLGKDAGREQMLEHLKN